MEDIDLGRKNQLIHHFGIDFDMKEPIIISDSGDVNIFETRQLAERYIEPIDVHNNEFSYYDSEGKILQAIVVKDSKGTEKTVITDSKEEKFNESKLKQILIDFLEHLNYPRPELEKMKLSLLIREGLRFKTE